MMAQGKGQFIAVFEPRLRLATSDPAIRSNQGRDRRRSGARLSDRAPYSCPRPAKSLCGRRGEPSPRHGRAYRPYPCLFRSGSPDRRAICEMLRFPRHSPLRWRYRLGTPASAHKAQAAFGARPKISAERCRLKRNRSANPFVALSGMMDRDSRKNLSAGLFAEPARNVSQA